MNSEWIPWVEKYRPKKLDEIIGQEDIIIRLKEFVKRKDMPHLIFAGPAGVGKTTTALALANELYGEENIVTNFLELNASDERGINVVRGKIKEFAKTKVFGEVPFKIIFLDEADALTSSAQQALRRTMEMYYSNTRFILSCNYSSKIIEPIQSRAIVFRFRKLTEEEMAKMINRIAEKEDLILEEGVLDAIYYVSEGDMRKAINVLQGAAVLRKTITKDMIFRVSSRARPEEIKEMLIHALKGEFIKSKEFLQKLLFDYGMSGEDIIKQVHKEIVELPLNEKEKIEAIHILGEYAMRLMMGANERIQLEAFLAKLMLLNNKEMFD